MHGEDATGPGRKAGKPACTPGRIESNSVPWPANERDHTESQTAAPPHSPWGYGPNTSSLPRGAAAATIFSRGRLRAFFHDPTTGGGTGNQPRVGDIYTGGTSGLTSTEPNRDPMTGGRASGLASVDPPRDPVTRGTGLLPDGALLSRTAAIDYLSSRRPALGSALRPSFG